MGAGRRLQGLEKEREREKETNKQGRRRKNSMPKLTSHAMISYTALASMAIRW